MKKTSDTYFAYPPNFHQLDLATLVSMYRERGMPKKARPGEYFACAYTKKLIKEGKWWFGQYYSQQAWDELLTKSCEGYPLTEVEMKILGMALSAEEEAPHRDYVEQNSGVIPKLAYMIVNDLKEFGFLSMNDQERLMVTPRGEKALQGLARRLYGKKFSPKMIDKELNVAQPTIERAKKKEDDQPSLF